MQWAIAASFRDSLAGLSGTGLPSGGEGGIFAAEVVRRTVRNAPATVASGPAAQGDTAQTAQTDAAASPKADAEAAALQNALAGTIDYVTQRHGAKAATAVMAIVMKRTGNGDVTEESLGNGLLDATRFLDRQFGTSAGDAFMDQMNGELNTSLNDYFDNGHNERFFAVTTPLNAGGSTAIPLPEKTSASDSATDPTVADLMLAMGPDGDKKLTPQEQMRKQLAAMRNGDSAYGSNGTAMEHEKAESALLQTEV